MAHHPVSGDLAGDGLGDSGAAGPVQTAGHVAVGVVGEFRPAQDILAEPVPEGIHRLIQPHFPLVLLRGHAGEEVVLLVRAVRKLRDLNAQLPQGRFFVPHLVEDTGTLPVQLPGDAGGAAQLALVGEMAKLVGPQVDGHTGAVLSLCILQQDILRLS